MLMLCSCLAVTAALGLPAVAGAAVELPPGFQQRTVFSGLTYPTAARFAPDGRVFVAEKSGRILAYDGVDDVDETLVADLRQEVYNYSDRGLLGLAVDPQFPARPYLYAMYTRDALPGGAAPYWGAGEGPPYENEDCPGAPQVSAACIVSGRLVKITVNPATNVAIGPPQTLVDDWCSEFLSHSVGDLVFGADGQLYASGGDGADFDDVDYGQKYGNPCNDPVKEGGALRSLDLRTAGDPVGLDGTIIRIDPDTGTASIGNPLASHPDANARRIVADGLRNPFRFAVRPGTGDLWIGDVGWGSWEEVNRLPNPAGPGASKKSFGWPCYEGDGLPGSRRQDLYGAPSYDLQMCEDLYAEGQGAVTAPTYSYFHAMNATDSSKCTPARAGELAAFETGSSVTGMAFYTTGDYGSEYEGGLFFADYTRQCIWFMGSSEDGPDPTKVQVFAENADFPIDLQRGPGGDLFYADIVTGDINRIERSTLTVSLAADKTFGPAPLQNVHLTATAGGNQGGLTYTWDFNGDGVYGDSGEAGANVTRTFTQQIPGVKVRVRVTDGTGQTSTSKPVLIAAGDEHPPVAQIDAPTAARTWFAGEKIDFAGTGIDLDEPGDETPASRMRWDVILQHCPGGCHEHFLRSFEGDDAGTFTAIQHEYPARLTLRLTVTDEYGLKDTQTMELEPQTVVLCVLSDPSGRSAVANLVTGPTPLKTTVIRGSVANIATEQVQEAAGRRFVFDGWSDGGALSHTVVTDTDTTITARFLASPVFTLQPAVTGTAAVGSALTAVDGAADGGSAAVALSRRWQRCDAAGGACADIPGATAPTYTPVAADGGRRLRLQVDARNGVGTATGTSPATGPVTTAAPAAAVQPAYRRRSPLRLGRDGRLGLRVRCAAKTRCSGSLVLTRPGARGTLARAALRIGARRTVTVKLRLSPSARRLLARRRSFEVQSTLTLRPAGAGKQTTRTRFKLLAPR